MDNRLTERLTDFEIAVDDPILGAGQGDPQPIIEGDPEAESREGRQESKEEEGLTVELEHPPGGHGPEGAPEDRPGDHREVEAPDLAPLDELMSMSGQSVTSSRAGRARRARDRIARLHGELLDRWRDDLRDLIGLMTVELKRYQAVYEADFRGPWRAVDGVEFEAALASADVILGGDYHTLPAAQRLPIRLLRRLLPRDPRPTTLALEMIHSEDQPVVDRYLAGRIGLEALRRAIDFDRRWGFDWRHYGALLRFAREHGLSVLGINCEPGVARGRLLRRDEHAARVMAAHLAAHPGRRLYVLAGDWHMARAHLPARLRRAAREAGLAPRMVIVHQNHERLLDALGRDAGGASTVARRGRDLFCILNTTPLVKLDSRRRWSAAADAAGAARSEDEADEWLFFEPVAAFHEVDDVLARHLDLPPLPADVDILEANDIALARAARRANAGPGTLRHWRRRLEERGTVRPPRSRTLLVARAPAHRLAEESIRLRLDAAGRPRLRGLPAFLRRTIDEGAAMFASRLLNPDRKCRLLGDWSIGDGGTAGAWVRALARHLARRPGVLPFSAPGHPFLVTSPAMRNRVAAAVGAAWGWHLFELWTAGDVTDAPLRRLLDPDRDDAGLFLEAIRAWPESAFTATRHDRL